MRFTLKLGGRHHDVLLAREGDRYKVEVDGHLVQAEASRGREATRVVVDGRAYEIRVEGGAVLVDGERLALELTNLQAGEPPGHHAAGAHGRVRPPMPGKVVALRVKVGDEVKAGQTLLVLEAMKMQNEIASPVAGTVKEIKAAPGQAVEPKDVLVVVE